MIRNTQSDYRVRLQEFTDKIMSSSMKGKLWINKCTLTFFVALGILSELKAAENGEHTVGFSFMTMLQHTGRFRLKVSWQKDNETTAEHPPYSHKLTPTDFYLFPQLKFAFKGRHFHYSTDIIMNVTEELKRLSQNGFQECFKHLYSRW